MFILRSRGLEKDVKGIVVLNGVIFGLLVGFGHLVMTMFGVLDTAYIKDSRYGRQHRKNNKDIQKKSYLSIQDWNLEIKEMGCRT